MILTQRRLFLLTLLMLMGPLMLSGCGVTPGSQTASAADNKPDSVRISIDAVDSAQKPTVLTLTSRSPLVTQLYTSTFGLSLMPPDQVCTLELGPHYTLTFLHGDKTLATALAKRDGCRPVTITGEKRDRQATSAFWTQLDQAIQVAKS